MIMLAHPGHIQEVFFFKLLFPITIHIKSLLSTIKQMAPMRVQNARDVPEYEIDPKEVDFTNSIEITKVPTGYYYYYYVYHKITYIPLFLLITHCEFFKQTNFLNMLLVGYVISYDNILHLLILLVCHL